MKRIKPISTMLSLSLISACGSPDFSANVQAGKSNDTQQSTTVKTSQTTNNETTNSNNPIKNNKPVIHSISANPTNTAVSPDDKITFTVVATDADNDTLRYTWSATKGTLSATGGEVTSWSPLRGDGQLEVGTATISVIIHDGKEISTNSVNIQIQADGVSVDTNSQTDKVPAELQKTLEAIQNQLKSPQVNPPSQEEKTSENQPEDKPSQDNTSNTEHATNTQSNQQNSEDQKTTTEPTIYPLIGLEHYKITPGTIAGSSEQPFMFMSTYNKVYSLDFQNSLPFDLYLGSSQNNLQYVKSLSGNNSISNTSFTASSGTTYGKLVSSNQTTGSYSVLITPSATPSPEEDDISVIERTTFNGLVYDDTSTSLDGVTVTAKSLNSSVAYEVSTVTAGGTYAFNNAPAGIQIEITASRNGYTTRRRVEVLKSNKTGDPTTNRYDFGGSGPYGDTFNAISDQPEVTMVTPGRNASGVSPNTSFVLRFSEPMDRQTVADNFEVRAYTTKTLSVDNKTTLSGSNSISSTSGSPVWDKTAFTTPTWNSDHTEVTFSFREERILPTDRDSDLVPDYQVSLKRQGGNLKDKSGIIRSSKHFKLTDGDFEETYKFSINTDNQKPSVSSINAQTSENGSGDGDAIKLRFSERMIHYTLSGSIAGGMAGVSSQAAAANNSTYAENAANNYLITVVRNGIPVLGPSSWASLGGRAVFDTNDPTHKTVLLLPASGSDLYKPGDNVIVEVSTSVLDPAGNSVNASGNTASANAS